MPPPNEPGRRTPRFPLPPYRYVPGLNPHPFRHAGGHMLARNADLDTASREHRFAHGVDLFNATYFWEAHEVWEELWHGAARDSTERAGLQSLIQLAAALLKREMGALESESRLMARARDRLEALDGEIHGLPVERIREALATVAAGGIPSLPE